MAPPDRPPGATGRAEPSAATSTRPTDQDATSGTDEVASTVPLDKPGAPPIAWRRNLYAVWIAQLLAIVGFSLRVPFLPFYLGDLGVASDEGQALWSGWINAAGAATMAISAPIWGLVADRRGRRPMLLRAMFAATATVGLMGLATRPWHLLALRLVEGAFTGTVTASTALVAGTTPKARLGYALGMVQTAVFTGASLGPLFGGVLADRIGPRPTFAVASACLGGAGLIVLFLVRERFVPPRTVRGAPGLGRFARLRASAGFLLGGAMLALIAVLFAVRLAAMAVQPILPIFVKQLVAAGGSAADASTVAGLVLGVVGVTSALSAVLLGRLGDRRGHRRVLIGCAAAAGLLYLPMAAAQNPWQLVGLQALFGAAAGGLIPSANALVANLTPPERRGAVYGVTAAAASLGGFVGPLAGAAIAAALGFRATFVATAALLLLLAVGIARTRLAGATDR